MRRLPIEEQQLRTADGVPARYQNLILNVDSVVTALLAVHGGSSWAAALDAAVPMRKRLPLAAAARTSGSAGSSGSGNADGDGDGDARAHASSSGDDTAAAGAPAADAGPASAAGSGSVTGLTCLQQQGTQALVDTAAIALQRDAVKQQRQTH